MPSVYMETQENTQVTYPSGWATNIKITAEDNLLAAWGVSLWEDTRKRTSKREVVMEGKE